MDVVPAALRRLCAAGTVVLAAACGPSGPLLGDARSSAQALAGAVLGALAQGDREALRALALDEEEFRAIVWPELPAAQPGRNLPFWYVWGDLHQKSEQALATTLARHGGSRYTLVSVGFAGGMSRYGAYTVHRETVLEVRDHAGALQRVRIFGSAIEHAGVWKVFSYVVDD